MTNNRDLSSLLLQLGLTEYESKTLNTLFRMGEAEAPSISRLAQVPKTRVYDVLDKLVEKNLVIEIRGRPKRYRGIEPKKAFDLLLEKKKIGLRELEGKVSSIENVFSQEREESGETVMKVKDKNDFNRILAQEISKAKNSIVGFAELSDKSSVLKEAIEAAGKRNVNVKLLNSGQTMLPKAANAKQADHGLNAYIVDDKKVVLALSDFKQDKPEYHFTIFRNHKPVANALQNYFEKIWSQSKK